MIPSPLKFTCTLCKKVILVVDVDHTVLQYALPLVLNPSNLIVGTKDDVAHAWTIIRVLLAFRV